MGSEGVTDVVGMRWGEAIEALHREGARVAGIEVTQPPQGSGGGPACWRVVRQRRVAPAYQALTLAAELGYRGRPVIAPQPKEPATAEVC